MGITEKIKKALFKKGLDENGREIMDPKPNRIALGLGQQKSEPLHLMVKRMIRENANAFAMENGQETFEEANDFEVDDDFPVETVYEKNFDTQVPDSVMQAHIADLQKRYEEANQKYNELAAMNKKEKVNESTNETTN